MRAVEDRCFVLVGFQTVKEATLFVMQCHDGEHSTAELYGRPPQTHAEIPGISRQNTYNSSKKAAPAAASLVIPSRAFRQANTTRSQSFHFVADWDTEFVYFQAHAIDIGE